MHRKKHIAYSHDLRLLEQKNIPPPIIKHAHFINRGRAQTEKEETRRSKIHESRKTPGLHLFLILPKHFTPLFTEQRASVVYCDFLKEQSVQSSSFRP